HRPHWIEAASELAWCEGMVSPDPARVGASLETLVGSKSDYGPDLAAIWSVAARLEKLGGAVPDLVARATKVRAAVEEKAAAVVAVLDQSLGKGKLAKVDGKPWMGLALRFLEDLDGVPTCAAWSKAHAPDLTAVDKAGEKSGTEYWQNVERNPDKAFSAAVDGVEQGWRNASATTIAATLEEGREHPKAIKAGKKELAHANDVLAAWQKARKDGFATFESSVKGFAP